MAINFSERTIDKFKSQMKGGGARSNLFEVSFGSELGGNFTFPWGDSVSTDDNMMIKAAGLPASTITEVPVPFRGRTLKVAGERTFDVWTITVINDTDFKWRNIFERWMNYIVKVSDGSGTIDPSEYQTEVTVAQLSRGQYTGLNNRGSQGGAIDVLRRYTIHGVFPTNVSQIDLSYNNENEVEEFTVDLQVQWWEAYDDSNSASSQVI
jgi:hypothetical protein